MHLKITLDGQRSLVPQSFDALVDQIRTAVLEVAFVDEVAPITLDHHDTEAVEAGITCRGLECLSKFEDAECLVYHFDRHAGYVFPMQFC